MADFSTELLVWKWSSQVQVALGKMADFEGTAVSQEWRHKKEKSGYQSFSLMVSCQKM